MSNLLQIRNNSFVKLAESSGATFTDVEMNEFINQEYQFLQTIISSTNEDYFAKSATFNSIENKETYQFPQDFLKLLILEEKREGKWIEIVLVPIYKKEQYKEDSLYSSTFEYNRRFYLKGDCFGIVPIIKNPIANGLRITYIPILPVLAEDEDIPAILPLYHELLEIGAVNRCRQSVKEPPINEVSYETLKNSLIQTIQPRVKAAPKQVRMVRGLY